MTCNCTIPQIPVVIYPVMRQKDGLASANVYNNQDCSLGEITGQGKHPQRREEHDFDREEAVRFFYHSSTVRNVWNVLQNRNYSIPLSEDGPKNITNLTSNFHALMEFVYLESCWMSVLIRSRRWKFVEHVDGHMKCPFSIWKYHNVYETRA